MNAGIGTLVKNRRLVWMLAVRQLSDRYLDTLGGAAWTVLNPLLLLAVYWYVFEVGLRFQSNSARPFVLVLFTGLIPWMTLADAIVGATGAVTGRAYLVKKISFPLEILPFANVLAALGAHWIMLCLLGVALAVYGVWPGSGLLLIPYYLFALCALVSGPGLALAALNVFSRDVAQAVTVVMNIWFWTTPVVWPPETVSERFRWVLKYNPANYVISGYRDNLLTGTLVPPDAGQTLYFWTVVVLLLGLGWFIFMRLKASFVDSV